MLRGRGVRPLSSVSILLWTNSISEMQTQKVSSFDNRESGQGVFFGSAKGEMKHRTNYGQLNLVWTISDNDLTLIVYTFCVKGPKVPFHCRRK